MYVIPIREVTSMVRMFTAAALVVLSTSAFAQFMEPVKGIKYGDGCIGPLSTYAARLGACAIANTPQQDLAYAQWAKCEAPYAQLEGVGLDGRITFLQAEDVIELGEDAANVVGPMIVAALKLRAGLGIFVLQ